MRKPIQMKMEGYEVVEKRAAHGGNSARVYVPRHWIGKRVKVVLIEWMGLKNRIKRLEEENARLKAEKERITNEKDKIQKEFEEFKVKHAITVANL